MGHKKPADAIVYLLYFLSGFSGLVYEVVWVRIFGNLFGNTVYSAAIVTSAFMLGLGVGGYLAGIWSDKRYAEGRASSFLRSYGHVELGVAALALLVVMAFPLLEGFSGSFARYVTDGRGWQHLSLGSHLFQMLAAVALILPITTLMGATLILLIRHLLSPDLRPAGWKIGALYGLNTAGAALGCFSTDLFLVPRVGILRTQLAAISINLAVGAMAILWTRKKSRDSFGPAPVRSAPGAAEPPGPPPHPGTAWPVTLALFSSGFAAMGMEIVWFRFLSAPLGGFRVVFSLMLTVILIGIWLGSLAGGYAVKRWGNPADRYMLVQAVFIFTTPLLLIAFNGGSAEAYLLKRFLGLPLAAGLPRLTQIWGVARPILTVIGLPAFLMGFSFPLANAQVQRLETSVGRRAGVLYLANTLGGVLGAIAAGFILLPHLGSQRSVLVLCFASGLTILFLQVSKLKERRTLPWRPGYGLFAACVFISAGALISWSALPADYLVKKSFPPLPSNGRILTTREGLTEMLMVVENPSGARTLYTNGHPMSSDSLKAQRYMRAFAHIPLMQMSSPRSVLVICFGIGNTLHAASLHPTIQRLDTVDLSEQILDQASFFRGSNRDVLADRRVSVFINDGRLHLRMMPPASYDLITLEPPPIAFAGVSSLYSREFYQLARSRLKNGGFMTQWLPLYQVSPAVGLSMVRAFLDVFPDAVLLSGMDNELIIMGKAGGSASIDPDLCSHNLGKAPLVQADLQRIKMGTLTEIIGSFVANSGDLQRATRWVEPVTDDNRSMEHGMISRYSQAALPSELFRVNGIAAWCPNCFQDGHPRSHVFFLPNYLAALSTLYASNAFHSFRYVWGAISGSDIDFIDRDGSLGTAVSRSPYLMEMLASPLTGSLGHITFRSADGPWSIQGVSEMDVADAVTGIRIAMKYLRSRRLRESIRWFNKAIELDPDNVSARFGLGYALSCAGDWQGAVAQYRRGLASAPENIVARLSLATVLDQAGLWKEEEEEYRRILRLEPGCSEAAIRLERLLRASARERRSETSMK